MHGHPGAVINGAVDIYGHVWATINGHLVVINGAVDIYGHVWVTINGSKDTQVVTGTLCTLLRHCYPHPS